MREITIRNTRYRLFNKFKENGKELISVMREIELNPYCWDSTFYVESMSWRRYKKFVKSHD